MADRNSPQKHVWQARAWARLHYARVFFDTGPLPANLPFAPQLLANKLAVHRERRR